MPAEAPLFSKRLDSMSTELEAGSVYLVGVAIFRPTGRPSAPPGWQLLVVKRAEHEDAFPNNWELPGGHVEPGETVRETVTRETLEETGLTVEKILGEFADLYWDSSSRPQKNVQLNYAVTVTTPMEIRLNPEEHCEWKWIDEAEVDGLLMTPAMNKVLKDSFGFSKAYMEATPVLSSQKE